MKRSRLNLFRATSMTISLLGILMVIATIVIFVYIGFQGLSSKVSSDVGSGSAYDQLAGLKAEYRDLKEQYDEVKVKVDASGDDNLKTEFVKAELELVKADSAILDVDSALSASQPQDEVDRRLDLAKAQLQKARDNLGKFKSMM